MCPLHLHGRVEISMVLQYFLLPKPIQLLYVSLVQLLCLVHGCHQLFEVHNLLNEAHKIVQPQHKRQSLDHTYSNKSKKNRVVVSPLTKDDIGTYSYSLKLHVQVKPVLMSLISGFNDLYVLVVFFQSH